MSKDSESLKRLTSKQVDFLINALGVTPGPDFLENHADLMPAARGDGEGPPDGDDPGPDGPAAEEQPSLRERWLAEAAAMKPDVEAAIRKADANQDQIRASWLYANEKAETETEEGYRTGLQSLENLRPLVAQALAAEKSDGQTQAEASKTTQQDKDQVRWNAVERQLAPRVEAVLSRGESEAGDVRMLWSFATEKATGSEFGPAFAAVKKMLPILTALESKAAPGKVDAEAHEAETRERAAEQEEARSADAALRQAARDAIARVAEVEAAIAAFGAPHPADWDTGLAALKAVTLPDEGAEPTAFDAVVAALKDPTDALLKSIADATSEREEWTAGVKIFKARLDVLKAHPSAAADPPVAPMIAGIETRFATAKAKADAFNYGEAALDLPDLIKDCDEARDFADGYLHFQTILSDREQSLTELPAVTDALPTKHAQIKTAIQALHDLVTAAKAAPDYDQGIAELDKIPSGLQAAKRLVAVAERYDANYATLVAKVATLKANVDPEVQAVIGARLGRLETKLLAADVANTGDFIESDNQIAACSDMVAILTGTATDIENYQSWKVWFDPEVEAIRVHPGRRGIEPFYQKVNTDKTAAEAQAGLEKYVAATKILSRYDDPDFATHTTIADRCVAYEATEDALRVRIETIEARGNAATLGDGIANLRALYGDARTASARRDFDVAEELVDRADTLAQKLEDQLDADAELAALGEQIPMDDLVGQFDVAKAKAEEMVAYVRDKRDGTDFEEAIAFLQQHIDTAQDEFDVGEGRDLPGLEAIFRNVIQGAADILQKIAQKERYKAAHDELEVMHDTTLPDEEIDDCLQDDLTEIDGLIKAAETSAAEPTLDFAAALDTLAEARKKADRALVKAKLFKERKPDLETARPIVAALETAARREVFAEDVTRIKALLQAVDDDWTAGRYEESRKKAAKAKEWRDSYQQLIADCDATLTVFNDRVLNYKGWDSTLDDWGVGEIVKTEKATADTYIAQIKAAMQVKAFSSAQAHCYNVSDLADMAQKVLDRKAAYDAALATAEARIKLVRDKANKGVEDGLADLDAKLRTAAAYAADRRFRRATELVQTLPAIADALSPVADRYAAFLPVKEQAEQDVADLRKEDAAGLIAPRLEDIERQVLAAEAQEEARDFDAAKTGFEAVSAACTAARAAMVQRAALEEAARAGATDSADKEALTAALTQVSGVLEAVTAKPDSPFAVAHVTGAREALDAARSKLENDDLSAGADIATAADLCARAETAIAQYGFLVTRCDDALAELSDLLRAAETTAPGYISADGARLTAALAEAKASALSSGELEPSLKELDAACKEIAALTALMADHAEFQREFKERTDEVDALEAHKCRFAIAKEIKALRTNLRRAESMAKARDHASAMNVLLAVALDETTAKITADMQANEDIDVDDLKAIIARPGGDKELDAIIEKLDARTQRKVINAAMEARFGVEFKMFEDSAGEGADAGNQGDTERAPNIRRMYELMKDLPNDDTLDNDSMEVMVVTLEWAGSDFDFRTKVMGVREGKEFESHTRPLATEQELGLADGNPDVEPGDAMTLLSWNTLHEVGHAVDDKKSIMVGNLEQASHGNWKEFGGNVAPVAEDFATAHDYDKQYAAAYLSGNADPPTPLCPDGVDEAEWERRRIAMTTQIDAARAEPWDSQSASKACVLNIGGTDYVYQESYPTWWTRYPLNERSKGVTGYQFRAPGEWFSELYAAFKSNRLKSSHPYYDLMNNL